MELLADCVKIISEVQNSDSEQGIVPCIHSLSKQLSHCTLYGGGAVLPVPPLQKQAHMPGTQPGKKGKRHSAVPGTFHK